VSLFNWLAGIVTVAVTLIPVFLIWACAVIWWRSRSPWALAALAGASSAVTGMICIWIGFFVHYSSTETMMAQNANPDEQLHLALEMSLALGFFVAAFALVGYARTLPRTAPAARQ
jgi:hypothetical protein